MSSSNILLLFCLLFIGGVFFASFQNWISYKYLKLLIYLIVFFVIFFIFIRKWKYILILVGCFVFLLGVMRYQNVNLRVSQNQLSKFSGIKISIIGKIVSEPILKDNSINFILVPEWIQTSQDKLRLVKLVKILVVTQSVHDYKYGDILFLKGKLVIPSVFSDFNYRMFLAKDGIYFILYNPQISIWSKHSTNNLYSFIFTLKRMIRNYIADYFPTTQVFILRSIILGDKNYLPSSLKDKLNIVGIRHIMAISGMHIVIIESILMVILLGLGFWRNQALYFTLFLSFVFITMTGFQISAVRAWIMGSFYIFSGLIGEKGDSFRILIFTAVMMLIYNPLILRYDIGFQLSFLAVLGIIYFTPLFDCWLKFIPNEKFVNLRNILAMTLSAQIATFPLLIYYFKHVSLIAPLANMLIIPIIPFLISFGLLFSILGLLSPFLGFIFLFPCYFFLSYIEWIINFLAQFPFYLRVDIPLFYIIVLYVILVFIVRKTDKASKLKFLDYEF